MIQAGLCAGTPAMQALQGACEELAKQWPAQRQSVTAALDSSRKSNGSSSRSGPASDAAMLSALAWAEAVVERCAVGDARTGRAAITELTAAMPQVRPLPCQFDDLCCPTNPLLYVMPSLSSLLPYPRSGPCFPTIVCLWSITFDAIMLICAVQFCNKCMRKTHISGSCVASLHGITHSALGMQTASKTRVAICSSRSITADG